MAAGAGLACWCGAGGTVLCGVLRLGLAVLAPSVWIGGLLGIGGYGAAKMLSENWVHYETSPSDEVLVAVGMQRDSFDELVSQWREQAGKAPRRGCLRRAPGARWAA